MPLNHGLYTDTAWNVACIFTDADGDAINLTGLHFVADVYNDDGSVAFTFKSNSPSASQGTIDRTNAATGQLNFIASVAVHDGLLKGHYRIHLKVDGSGDEDTWQADGDILIGIPGSQSTYIKWDRVTAGNGTTALPVTVSPVQDGDKDGVIVSNSGAVWWPTASIYAFGGTGSGDETDVIEAAEASEANLINLEGLTITASIDIDTLTKHYWNGEILGEDGGGDSAYAPTSFPALRNDLTPDSTSTPFLDYDGAKIWWGGTSIPAEGGDDTYSYPALVAKALGGTIVNMSWAGSHARYPKSVIDAAPTDSSSLNQVKALSMTEDDRVAGVAAFGSGSVYDDSFNDITKASKMTCDWRILAQFATAVPDIAILDHNHNDRGNELGTLSPPSVAISSITKGTDTTIVVASAGTFSVGDAIALRVTGITNLDYHAARVQGVSGTSITIGLDTSGYSGSFSSGTAYKLDRETVYGAFEFLIYYMKWAAALYGNAAMPIVLCSAPSAYTGDSYDSSILSNAKALRKVAAKWGLAFFDVQARLKMDALHHTVMFTDDVHPVPLAAREALRNIWVEFLTGGAARALNPDWFLPSGVSNPVYTSDREPVYDGFLQGFRTSSASPSSSATVLIDDDFSGGIGAYTVTGPTPSVVAAPWNAAEWAVLFSHDGSTATRLSLDSLSFEGQWSLSFKLWLDEVSGQSAEPSKLISIINVRSAAAYYSLQLVVSETSVQARVIYFAIPNDDQRIIQGAATLSADTAHVFSVEARKQTATDPGGLIFKVDGVQLNEPIEVEDEGQNTPDRIYFGLFSSTTGQAFTAYFGDLLLETYEMLDTSERFTGTALTLGGKTLTFVGGKVTTEASGLDTVAKKMDMANATGLPVVLKSGRVAGHTGATGQTTLVSVTLPGGKMGTSGKLRISIIGEVPNNANSKTWRVRLGATSFLTLVQSTTVATHSMVEIQNAGSQTAQAAYYNATSTSFGSTTNAITTGTEDTSADIDVLITAQLADAADTMNLHSYTIEFIPAV